MSPIRSLLLALLLLLSGCTQLIFQPLKPHLNDPAKLGIEVEEHYFTTADGIKLHGWLLPAQGKTQGTLLFLHGNAENISTHIGSIWWLPKHGYNVFIFDYRGYGRSEGSPTLDGTLLDLQAAMAKVVTFAGVQETGLVVFGQSLGASITINGLAQMEDKRAVRGVVIEGGITSFRDLARELLGKSWLTWSFQWPLGFTIDDHFRSIDEIGKLEGIPLLLIHSRTDEIIPFHHGEELYDAAKAPKEFWAIKQARHISTFIDKRNQLRLIDWLDARFQ